MSAFVLCLVTQRQAEHLMGAARLAGGWVATHDVVRYACDDALRRPLLIALLPADWSEAERTVPREDAEIVARRLESMAAGMHGIDRAASEVAADFAARIREARSRGAVYDLGQMEVVRSDLGDGGWSIHVRRTDVDEDDDPQGAWPIVASGESDTAPDGTWTRPDDADWAAARARAQTLTGR